MQSGSHHASRQSRSDLRLPGKTRVPLVSSTHAPLVQCRSFLCMGRPGVLSMNLRIGYSSALSAAGGGCRCWCRSSVPSYLRMAFPPSWLHTSKRSALDCSLGSSGAGSGSACSSTSEAASDGFYWSWAVSVSLPSGRDASVCAFECVRTLLV